MTSPALSIIPQTAHVPPQNAHVPPPTPAVNRQYVQRCLFNWRHQLGIDLSVEEHAVFREHKKSYMKMGELSPSLMCKMISHYHPDFQFPSNPIPIIAIGEKGHNGPPPSHNE
jgi:hypothetical protein